MSNLCFRDDITLSQTRNLTTNEDLSRENTNTWGRENEEDPRNYTQSPEPNLNTSSQDQDQLTWLLDKVLEAQAKYAHMFPEIEYLINEKQTKSFEDITFCMLRQGLFLYDQWKKLNSKLNGDYLSVINKRLLVDNDMLTRVKEQSYQIIASLKEDISAQDSKIITLEEQLKVVNKNLPSGDIELRAKRSKERDNTLCQKLKFETDMKDEALTFKDKSLKQANAELKKLRNIVLEQNERNNMQEQNQVSLKSQIQAKNDLIRRLESKVKAFKDTKSIAIELETNQSVSEVRSQLSDLNSKLIFTHYNIGSLTPTRTLTKSEFENKTFWNGQNRQKSNLSKKKIKVKSKFEKLNGIPYDSMLAMMICQAKDLEGNQKKQDRNVFYSPPSRVDSMRSSKKSTPKRQV